MVLIVFACVFGGVQRLPRLIGLSRDMDMILTGRSISAEEALAMGLANCRKILPMGRKAQPAPEQVSHSGPFEEAYAKRIGGALQTAAAQPCEGCIVNRQNRAG
jgi:enoyl-CoA hydratase/carnithine racemase